MIRGYFSSGSARRPFVSARIQFPGLDNRMYPIEFLIDTGADRTLLSPVDASRIGINLAGLPTGSPGTGIGGQASVRTIDSVLTMNTNSMPLALLIPDNARPIPSLLGRDVLSGFALFLEERTSRVILLEPEEADALALA